MKRCLFPGTARSGEILSLTHTSGTGTVTPAGQIWELESLSGVESRQLHFDICPVGDAVLLSE